MRRGWAILVASIAACGGGGGGSPPPFTASFLLVRPDAPTARDFPVASPLGAGAVVELVGPVDGPFAVSGLPATVPATGTIALRITVIPVGPGDLVGSFRLRFRGPGGGDVELPVLVSANAETPTLQVLTPVIDFGPVALGARKVRTITARNASAATVVTVTSIAAPPAGFTLGPVELPAPVAPGNHFSVDLEHSPVAYDAVAFALAIGHDGYGPPVSVTVRAWPDPNAWREVVDFGAVATSAGATAWFSFDVPEDAVSVSIEAIGAPGRTVGLLGFEGPGGVVYENEAATGSFLWNPGTPVLAVTLPQSDRAEPQLVPGGGTYRFRLSVDTPSASSMTVRSIVSRRPGAVVDGGRLPLNVHLLPVTGVSAASAPMDARVQAVVGEANRILRKAGLAFGSISYFDLRDPSLDHVTTFPQMDRLFASSQAAPQTGLNLFLVGTAGIETVGFAARIPGPMRNGTTASGVMIDFDFDVAELVGYIAAHEIGHYLGLYHPTEPGGPFDIIDDTAECPATGTSAECPTEGNDNLMHWQALLVDPKITPGQTGVLLRHPLVDPPSGTMLAPMLDGPPAAFARSLPRGWCGTPGCPHGKR